MCSRHVRRGVGIVDPDAEFLIHHHFEQFSRIMLELLAREEVIEERWPRDLCVFGG